MSRTERHAAITVATSVMLLFAVAWRAPEPPTPALYTRAQAERGRVQYDAQCADCHGAKLEGGNSTPLAGDAFFESWSRAELSLDDFYYIVRKTMPKETPGTLTREQYIDVVAFILQQNGFPEGDTELRPDPAILKAVRIERPAPRDTSVLPTATR